MICTTEIIYSHFNEWLQRKVIRQNTMTNDWFPCSEYLPLLPFDY